MIRLVFVFAGLGLMAASAVGAFANEDDPATTREFCDGNVKYSHIERRQPRPMHIHALRVNVQFRGIEWKVVVADDPDGDGPAEASLTSPFQLAKSQTNVIAVINSNPWSALAETDGKPAEKPVWYPGRPVDISGLAVSSGQLRSKPHPGYVSVWRDKTGDQSLGKFPGRVEDIEEGFGGFQQIAQHGKRLVSEDKSLHPRTGVGFNKDKSYMWFVVVDGRQPGYSEGMTTVELADLLLELGCTEAANLDGGGSSILAMRNPNKATLSTINRPSDRVAGGFSIARPLPMAVVVRETEEYQNMESEK